MTPSPIPPSFGAAIVGFAVACFLCGCMMVQVYLYFKSEKGKNDHQALRWLVRLFGLLSRQPINLWRWQVILIWWIIFTAPRKGAEVTLPGISGFWIFLNFLSSVMSSTMGLSLTMGTRSGSLVPHGTPIQYAFDLLIMSDLAGVFRWVIILPREAPSITRTEGQFIP